METGIFDDFCSWWPLHAKELGSMLLLAFVCLDNLNISCGMIISLNSR